MAPMKRLDEIEIQLVTTLITDVQRTFKDVYHDKYLRCHQKWLQARYLAEGKGFLTKTLPALGKAFDRALLGLEPLNIVGLRLPRRADGELPRFLGELFGLVFYNNGTLLPYPCTKAVHVIRQILYLFYKYELPYTDEDTIKVITAFKKAEDDLVDVTSEMSLIATRLGQRFTQPNSLAKLLDRRDQGGVAILTKEAIVLAARGLLERVFARFDPLDIYPAHGPGAVATRQQQWDKYCWTNVADKITEMYPFDAYFCASMGEVCDRYREFEALSWKENSARVVLVPKDSRGPRLISCEPVDYQWVQQGIMRSMVRHVESHPLTRDHVRFTNQVPNQNAALLGSRDGRIATLDLKEASDRVSLGLVRLLFPPRLVRCLEACRTTSTVLPDGSIQPLLKFAPMGSALCFPIMALSIWSLLYVTARCTSTRERTYVYGDDVIVPTAYAANAIELLESFGLKVNRDKSCTNGFFRESCGTEAFLGVNVTPLRLRTVWSSRPRPDAYTSWISYANSFLERGFTRTARFLAESLRMVYGPIPDTDMRLSAPSLHHSLCWERAAFRTRWNKDLQKVQFYVTDIRSSHVTKELPGWSMLLRFFAESVDRPKPDTEHPTGRYDAQVDVLPIQVRKYTRRRASTLVRRWR